MFLRYRPNVTKWREQAALLKEAREALRVDGNLMTAYEKTIIERDIKDYKEKNFDNIYTGATSQFSQAVSVLKLRKEKLAKAKDAENKRWDVVRLAGEMQAIQFLSDVAADAARSNPNLNRDELAGMIGKIFDEAMSSGDIYRQRAAAEVLQGARGKFTGEARFAANHVAVQAEKAMPMIRSTPEMLEAGAALETEYQAFLQARKEYRQVFLDCGESDPDMIEDQSPQARLLRTVQTTPAGEIKFYAVDDPAVTNIYFKGEPEIVGG